MCGGQLSIGEAKGSEKLQKTHLGTEEKSKACKARKARKCVQCIQLDATTQKINNVKMQKRM